jgi:phage-related protein
VKGDNFGLATNAILDMSAALGTDLQSSAIQVGKALNDPLLGISSLGRAGVQFTQDQKNLIASLTQTGDVAGAQAIIIKELEKQFGGMAAALAATPFGKFDQAMNVLGDSFEEVGKALTPVLTLIAELAITLADNIKGMVDAFTSLDPATQKTVLIFGGIVIALGPVLAIIGQAVIGIAGLMFAFSAIGGVLAPLAVGFSGLVASLGGAAGAIGGFGAILGSVAAFLVSWPVLLAALAASIGYAAVVIYQEWDRIPGLISGALESVTAAGTALLASLTESLGSFLTFMAGLGTSLLDFVGGLGSRLLGAIQGALGAVASFVGGVMSSIGDQIAALWARLPTGLTDAAETIFSVFVRIGEFIGDALQGVSDRVASFIDNVKSKVQSLLSLIGMARGASSGGGSSSGSTLQRFATGGQVGAGKGAAPILRRARVADGKIRGKGTGTSDSIVSPVRPGTFIMRSAAVRHYGPKLMETLNSLRAPASSVASGPSISSGASSASGQASPILARLSNGEFAVRPEAVRHYGVELMDLLNKIKLPRSKVGGSGFAKRIAGFAKGGQIPGPFSSGKSPTFSLGGLFPEGFAKGGQIPAFATGGIVSRAVTQYGPSIQQTFSSFAQPLQSFATGGLVSSVPVFAGSSAGGAGPAYANLSLTIGTERFDGLTAPKETADRLIRHSRSEEVKSAGRRPGWYRGI